MAYSVRQLKQILRHHLLLDGAVVALASTRVFTAHGRDTEQATREYPTLITEFRGGFEFTSAPVARREFYLYGYSNVSQDQATELYEAAADVIRRDAGLVAPPDESGGPCFNSCGYFIPRNVVMEGWNPQSAAWFARGTWFGWQIG